MSLKEYFKTTTPVVARPEGFQRKNAPEGPTYSKADVIDAINRGVITDDSFKNDFEWTGSNATAAVAEVVSAVCAERSKLSMSYKLADGSNVSPEEAGRMNQIKNWLAASGMNVETFPMSITGITIRVGNQEQSFMFPSTPPAISGTTANPAASANVTGNSNDPAGQLFNQLPAGSWKISGFDADGKPTRRVLFYEKKPDKLVLKTTDQAKKLIDDDDAEKGEFGWYLISGWTPSNGGHYRPTPDTTNGSKEPF